MLDDYGPQTSMSEKPCKPDYESMVKRASDRLKKTEALLNAIFAYNGNRAVRNKMAELVGELYSNKIEIEQSISSMMKNMEEQA